MSEDTIFCGVFDGHGPQGHLVARKVRDTLPVKLLSFWHSLESKQNRSGKTCFKPNITPDCGESEKDCSAEDKLNSTWREAFIKAYKTMDKELRSYPNLDCFCSGSTSVTVVKQVAKVDREASTLSFSIITFIFFLISELTRVQISSWDILGILEQSWDPKTAMTPWWQFS